MALMDTGENFIYGVEWPELDLTNSPQSPPPETMKPQNSSKILVSALVTTFRNESKGKGAVEFKSFLEILRRLDISMHYKEALNIFGDMTHGNDGRLREEVFVNRFS